MEDGLKYALCALSFFRGRHRLVPLYKKSKRRNPETVCCYQGHVRMARLLIRKARDAGFRGSVGGTTARARAAGTLIASRVVAEYLTRFLQKGVVRTGAYNPNDTLTGEYTGEKFWQTGPADGQKRWWINTTGTKWRTMKIQPGDIVKTNYNTGPYEVLEVHGGCTCPSCLDELNRHRGGRKRAPHLHLICCKVGKPKNRSYLNGFTWTAGGRLMGLEKFRHAPQGRAEVFIVGHKANAQLRLF